MSGSGPGYMQTIIITPYVHNMIYHVPQMMKKHGSLRKFSGQGIFINLYKQVHGTREIESPAESPEYIFPKVLVLKTLFIQTETFSPQY